MAERTDKPNGSFLGDSSNVAGILTIVALLVLIGIKRGFRGITLN